MDHLGLSHRTCFTGSSTGTWAGGTKQVTGSWPNSPPQTLECRKPAQVSGPAASQVRTLPPVHLSLPLWSACLWSFSPLSSKGAELNEISSWSLPAPWFYFFPSIMPAKAFKGVKDMIHVSTSEDLFYLCFKVCQTRLDQNSWKM